MTQFLLQPKPGFFTDTCVHQKVVSENVPKASQCHHHLGTCFSQLASLCNLCLSLTFSFEMCQNVNDRRGHRVMTCRNMHDMHSNNHWHLSIRVCRSLVLDPANLLTLVPGVLHRGGCADHGPAERGIQGMSPLMWLVAAPLLLGVGQA